MNTIDILGDEETFKNIVERTITEFEDNKLEVIGDGAFNGCTALTSVNLPAVTTIESSAFTNCTALTSISIPNVTSIGQSAFNSCTALTSVDLPLITELSSAAEFPECSALTSVNLPRITRLVDQTFSNCIALTTLYIGTESNTVCTLQSSSRFMNCPIANIYVPASLVDSYKSARNWFKFADKIKAYTGV